MHAFLRTRKDNTHQTGKVPSSRRDSGCGAPLEPDGCSPAYITYACQVSRIQIYMLQGGHVIIGSYFSFRMHPRNTLYISEALRASGFQPSNVALYAHQNSLPHRRVRKNTPTLAHTHANTHCRPMAFCRIAGPSIQLVKWQCKQR